MKKTVTSLMVAVGLIATVPATNAGFKDMTMGHKNAAAVNFLQETGVIGGYEDGTFKPGNTVNRAELAKILVEAQGITPDADQYNNCFPDVTDEWFAPYVCYAKEMGWVAGYPDGTFKPAQTVNKVEAIKMVINSQGFGDEVEECKAELFQDTDTSAWYSQFLCVAKVKGLLEEDENGNYVPANGMTRASVAENIYRSIMVRKLNKQAFTAELKAQTEEAKADFKADREAVRDEIQNMKTELQTMKEDGASDEEIKAAAEAFWADIKAAQKENQADFASQMQEIHQAFISNKEELREKFAECKEAELIYNPKTDVCEERPCTEDGTCANPLRERVKNALDDAANAGDTGSSDDTVNNGDNGDEGDDDVDDVEIIINAEAGSGTDTTGTGSTE